MGNRLPRFFLLLLASALIFFPQRLRAGDEDVREEKVKVERIKEEPEEKLPEIEAVESPAPSAVVEVPPAAPVAEPLPAAPPVVKQAPPNKSPKKAQEPDDNINYGSILSSIDPETLPALVRPEALGTRGYRPHMIALGVGDRTPGYGVMLEYSWNRIGLGASFAYRQLKPGDTAKSQTFGNLYSYYHWLPFWITPYFLLGVELGSQTKDSSGILAGVGTEAQIYRGWTITLGYTYHSVVRDGYLGGSFGWAF